MSTFSKKYESRADNILMFHKRKRSAVELMRSFFASLANQLAVIVGRCDLRSDLKQGSQSTKRVAAIQEIGRGMAKELNEYQCQMSESARSAGTQKCDVA
jgi:hypothetical protein